MQDDDKALLEALRRKAKRLVEREAERENASGKTNADLVQIAEIMTHAADRLESMLGHEPRAKVSLPLATNTALIAKIAGHVRRADPDYIMPEEVAVDILEAVEATISSA